jgi:hypothetical protein
MDKFGMIEDMQQKINLIADSTGALRCGLIWDISRTLQTLADVLKKEDEANTKKVEELKRIVENKEAE